MAHAIRLTRQASTEIDRIAVWYNEQQSGIGEERLRRVEDAIASLGDDPERCGFAHETEAFPYELRELLYGSGRKKTHRILFRVKGNEVIVLGIRHMAQQDVVSDDFGVS